MKCIRLNNNYNPFTLLPRKANDKQAFWNFRSNDIAEMYTVYIGMYSFRAIQRIFDEVNEHSQLNLNKMYAQLIQVAVQIILWLIGRRFQKKVTHCVMISFIMTLIIEGISLNLTKDMRADGDNNIALIRGTYVLACFILAPSMFFVTIYTLVYASLSVYMFKVLSIVEVQEIQLEMPSHIFISLGLFYILQRRELKRFFEQKVTSTKEQHLSNILNSHSDAIIVFEANPQHDEIKNANGGAKENKPSFVNFLLCNSQS